MSDMARSARATPVRLVDRSPSITGAEIVAELEPPPQFEHASFESYRPDLDYPSQLDAVERLNTFAAWRARPGGFFSRTRRAKAELPAVPGPVTAKAMEVFARRTAEDLDP